MAITCEYYPHYCLVFPFQLFVKNIFKTKYYSVSEEAEEMRKDREEGKKPV